MSQEKSRLSNNEKLYLLEAVPALKRFTVEEAIVLISQTCVGKQIKVKDVELYLSEMVELELIQAIGTRSSWEDGILVHQDIYCQRGRSVEMTADIFDSGGPAEYEDYGDLQDDIPSVDLEDKDLRINVSKLEEYQTAVSSKEYFIARMLRGAMSQTTGDDAIVELLADMHLIRAELLLNHGDILQILHNHGMLDEWSQVAYDKLQESYRSSQALKAELDQAKYSEIRTEQFNLLRAQELRERTDLQVMASVAVRGDILTDLPDGSSVGSDLGERYLREDGLMIDRVTPRDEGEMIQLNLSKRGSSAVGGWTVILPSTWEISVRRSS